MSNSPKDPNTDENDEVVTPSVDALDGDQDTDQDEFAGFEDSGFDNDDAPGDDLPPDGAELVPDDEDDASGFEAASGAGVGGEFDPNSFDNEEAADDDSDETEDNSGFDNAEEDSSDAGFDAGFEDSSFDEEEESSKGGSDKKKLIIGGVVVAVVAAAGVVMVAGQSSDSGYTPPPAPPVVQPISSGVVLGDEVIQPSAPIGAPQAALPATMPIAQAPTSQPAPAAEVTGWSNVPVLNSAAEVNRALLSKKAGFGNTFYEEKGYQPHVAYQRRHIDKANETHERPESGLSVVDRAKLPHAQEMEEMSVTERTGKNSKTLSIVVRQIELIAKTIDEGFAKIRSTNKRQSLQIRQQSQKIADLEKRLIAMESNVAKANSAPAPAVFGKVSRTPTPAPAPSTRYTPAVATRVTSNEIELMGHKPQTQPVTKPVAYQPVVESPAKVYRVIGAIKGKAWLSIQAENRMITVKVGDMLARYGRITSISANGEITLSSGTSLSI